MPSMAYFTEFLASTAEISNLMSVLAVLGGLLVMFVFLLRLIYQDIADGGGEGVTKVTHRSPQTNMTKVNIPFALSLQENCVVSDSGLNVRVKVSSTSPYYARFFWGVQISAFHHVLRAPWPWFYEAFLHGNLFGEEHCVESSEVREATSGHEERGVVIRKSSAEPLNLGQAPREVYPLVVVLVRRDSEHTEDLTEVTSLINIFHLKDSSCPIPSQILCTYMRQGAGVTLLRQMYLTDSLGGESSDTESAEDSETEDSPGDRGTKQQQARCIICQLGRVNRVALPCRHANTCGECFERLQNRCPMCRGFISSYFLLRPEPVTVDPVPPASPLDHPPTLSWGQRWNNWNMRVNAAMGLREN
eukprot:GFUD01053573.1.p1 GENE.GFUD01053573.1~~GFUD01053573.1.p1  ORF type:complete len:360 (+),score=113.45 GFUD01053573.1:61-1140(+)